MKTYDLKLKKEVNTRPPVTARQVADWIQKNLGKRVMVEQTGDLITWDDTTTTDFENLQIKNYLWSL